MHQRMSQPMSLRPIPELHIDLGIRRTRHAARKFADDDRPFVASLDDSEFGFLAEPLEFFIAQRGVKNKRARWRRGNLENSIQTAGLQFV